MFSDYNMKQSSQDSFAESLSREERINARQLMVSQFIAILEKSRQYNIYWKGTQTDLTELTYEMFLTGKVINPDGRPCSFKEMIDKAFYVLHKKAPCNPYSIVSRIRLRKGIRQRSFFSRYCWMLIKMRRRNPLEGMMIRVDPDAPETPDKP